MKMKKKILLFFILVFFAFIQATIFSFNFVLLLVLSWGVLRSAKSGLIFAFLAGLVIDLVIGKTLGLSSLTFLLIIALLNLYKVKFKATNFSYLLPFTFLSAGFYNLFAGEPLLFWNLTATTILLFLVWLIVNLLISQEDESGLQLPLKI